jgi:hypothetical protein
MAERKYERLKEEWEAKNKEAKAAYAHLREIEDERAYKEREIHAFEKDYEEMMARQKHELKKLSPPTYEFTEKRGYKPLPQRSMSPYKFIQVEADPIDPDVVHGIYATWYPYIDETDQEILNEKIDEKQLVTYGDIINYLDRKLR